MASVCLLPLDYISDGRVHLRRELVRFGVLAELSPELRPRARATVKPDFKRSLKWRIKLERHAAHRDHGHLPAREPVERIKGILFRPCPSGQLCDQYGVDHARLCEFEDQDTRDPVVPVPKEVSLTMPIT